MELLDELGHPLAPYMRADAWHENRRDTLRGSDATILAEGKADEIIRLWRLKTGRAKPSKKALSLAPLMGMATEDLHRRWFMATTGRPVWGADQDIRHPHHEWLGASLDGITMSEDGRQAYLELKCVSFDRDLARLYALYRGQFEELIKRREWQERVVLPELVRKYKPQLMHNCFVGGWEVSVLSALIGNQHHAVEIEFDEDYHASLFDLEERFWRHVRENVRPDASLMTGIGE